MSSSTEISPAPASRLRRLTSSTWFACFVISVVWQVFHTGLGWLLESVGNDLGADDPPGPLSHMLKWDGDWYRKIIESGYDVSEGALAFYPLLPVLITALQFLTFGLLPMLVAALLLNTVALAVALRGLLAVSDHLGLSAAARNLILVLVLTAPAAFTFHLFYTEALFLATAVWAYVFALRQQWPLMALCAALSTAGRLTGVLIVALCALQFASTHGWKLKRMLRWSVLWVPAGFAGLATFALYCYLEFGDPLAMVNRVRSSGEWSHHVFEPNILRTLGDEIALLWSSFAGGEVDLPVLLLSLTPFVSLLFLLAASVYLLVRKTPESIPLGLFGILAIIMFTLNSNIISVHRYVLTTFSIYLAAGMLADRHPSSRPVLAFLGYAGAVIQGWFLVIWVQGWGLVT